MKVMRFDSGAIIAENREWKLLIWWMFCFFLCFIDHNINFQFNQKQTQMQVSLQT